MDPVNSASMENADGKAADELLFLMNLSKKDGIQRIQSEHRLRLVRLWGVGRGERILEIGCGQGDTTAALAYCTGPEGFVWGIDPAGEDYGAPETPGMARDRLLSGPLAGRLRMDFGFDLVRDFDCLRGEAFDRVVLSHSLWYMDSYETLSEILKTCRRIGKKLSIAEWDPIAAEPEQAAHACAAFLQAVCGCFAPLEEANVRTIFMPDEIAAAVRLAGWHVERDGLLSSRQLQDGIWEKENARTLCPRMIEKAQGMPAKLRRMLQAGLCELEKMPAESPLDVYWLSACQ